MFDNMLISKAGQTHGGGNPHQSDMGIKQLRS